MRVTATLSAALSSDVTVPLSLSHGTAEDGDYGSLSSITILAGFSSATGTITTSQDGDADDETFTVALGTLPSGVAAGSPSSVTVTIAAADASGQQTTGTLLERCAAHLPANAVTQAEVYDVFIGESAGALTGIYAERGEALCADSARYLAIGINSVMDGLWLECGLNPSWMSPEEALRIALNLIGPRIGVTLSKRTSARGAA